MQSSITSETKEDGTVIVYYYEASTTTRYTVEVYYEYEGKYSSVPSKTETLAGTTDTQAIVAAETYLPTAQRLCIRSERSKCTERYNRW